MFDTFGRDRLFENATVKAACKQNSFRLENMTMIRNRVSRLLQISATAFVFTWAFAQAAEQHTTAKFTGAKANTGTAIHSIENGKSILRVSSDFKVPDTPAPTWRVVDSKGNVYTLDAFKIKGGEKREVVVPSYVRDIAKVQVYCAWAQVLLGETSFSQPVQSNPTGNE
jgi:hypothetical protein